MSAATRLGFEVKTSVAWQDHSSLQWFMWTMQRAGGELSPGLQHQLRKAVGIAQQAARISKDTYGPMTLYIQCN